MSDTDERPRAQFHALTEGTWADWELIVERMAPFDAQLPERALDHLRALGQTDSAFAVDRLTHSLQTATRAERAGRNDEYILCALLHDVGDLLSSFNHPDIGAAMVKPFVSEKDHWMVAKHGIFQGYYFFHFLGGDRDLREQYRDHPWFDHTAEFCAEYDQPSFDPGYDTHPLEHYEPLVRSLMAAPRPRRPDDEVAPRSA